MLITLLSLCVVMFVLLIWQHIMIRKYIKLCKVLKITLKSYERVYWTNVLKELQKYKDCEKASYVMLGAPVISDPTKIYIIPTVENYNASDENSEDK